MVGHCFLDCVELALGIDNSDDGDDNDLDCIGEGVVGIAGATEVGLLVE